MCHLQHKLIGFYNRNEKCLQRGTDWTFEESGLRFVFKRFLRLCTCILTVCLCMATLTEVFPCFFLSCKANVRAKTGHGPHSSQLLCCMYCLFYVVLCIVSVYMCTVLPPSGGYPIAVNKYIISYPGQVVIKQPTYPLYVTEQNITRRANRSNASKTAQLPRDHLKTT